MTSRFDLHHLFAACVLLLAWGVCSTASGAERSDYPTRPIRLLVSFPPGGGADTLARIVTPKFAQSMGQQWVVDNRSGASGNIAPEIVAHAAPDGHTVLLGFNTVLTVNPSLYKKLPFDVARDFQAVTQLAAAQYILVLHPSVPAGSLKEFIALAKAKPGELNYSSSGMGSPLHLAAELFKFMTHTKPVHIPYKGMGPAVTDVIGGQIQFIFGTVLAVVPHVRNGRLRALGVSSERRSESLPNLPTIAEAGVPGYSTVSWTGMHLPAGAPAAIVKTIRSDVMKVIARQDVRERFLQDGAEPAGGSSGEFGQFIRDEIVKWRKVIKAADIRID